MKTSQKVGSYAALVQGVLFIGLLGIFLVVLPSQGVTSPSELTDPAKAASVAPILAVISTIVTVFSASVILVALALYDRLQMTTPNRMRYSLAAAFVAGALFLSNAMVGIVGGQMLGQAASNASLIGPANLAFSAVSQGLLGGAIFAASWSVLLWAWAALSSSALPTVLSYVALLAGLAGIFQLAVPALQLVLFVLNVIWSLWLGMVLMREPGK